MRERFRSGRTRVRTRASSSARGAAEEPRLDAIHDPADARSGRWVRLDDAASEHVRFTIDGEAANGRSGDTLLAALLTLRPDLGSLAPERRPRAGFCLIGLCQDCWVRLEDGRRVRACTTPLEPGMAVRLDRSDEAW